MTQRNPVRLALICSLSLAAMALPELALAATPAASPVGPSALLSSHHHTDAKTYLYPVASAPKPSTGGRALAVYQRYNAVGHKLDATGVLIAVDAAGHRSKIGVVTPDMRGFSIVGGNLRALSAGDPDQVYSWQVPGEPGQTYATAALRPGHRYLGAAPTGWLSVDADGQLYEDDGTGAPRPLANPFGTGTDVEAVSGPAGAVVWNETDIVYVRYTTGDVTPLDTSKLTTLPGGTNTPTCWSASKVAVACGSYYFTGEDDSGLRNVFLDPLDGSPAYAVTADRPKPASMLGRTAAWRTGKGKLRVMDADGLRTSSTTIGAWPVAGLGGFLTTSAARHAGIRLNDAARRAKTVLPASRATTEVTGFALTDGAVMWVTNDDGRSAGKVLQRTVGRNPTHDGVTKSKVRKVANTDALRGSLAAAGKTVAYPTRITNSAVGQNGGETLRVVSPRGSATIHGVDRYLPVTLGSHRVAYYTGSRSARVYNLNTHRSQSFAVTGIALSGHWLAYADTTGTIRLKDLKTGTVRVVAIGVQIPEGELFLRGQVVAWNAFPPGVGGHLGFYRDMSGSAAAVQLPPEVNVWQLSDAGIVLQHTPAPPGTLSPNFPSPSALRFHPAMTFLLQPYDGGAASQLLVADYPVAGPQVAGNVVAWVDQHGRLRARALV